MEMKSDQGLPFASTSTSSSSTSTLPQDSGRQLLLPHPPGLNIYQPFHNRLKIRDSQSEYTLDELFVLWCDDAKKESFRNHLVADMYHSDSDSDADIDNTVIYGGMGVRDVDDAELLGEQDLFQETWRVYSSLQQQHEERTSDVLRRNHLLSVMYWSAHLDFLSRKHDSVNVTGSGFSTSGDDQEAPKLIPITTTQRQPHVNKISSTTQVSYTIPYNDGVVSNINKIAFRRDFQSLERHQYESARKKKKRKMNSSDPQSALSGPSPMKDYSKIYFYGCYNPMKNENFQKMKIETILPRSTFNRSSTSSSSSTLSMSLGFRFSQTRTHIATIKNLLIPCTLPLPNCMAWNKIVRNKRTDDDPVLRYIPYFGEWDTTGMDVSAWDLLPGQCEPEISREIDELLIVYMVQKSGGVIEKDYSSKFMIRNRVIQSVLCEFLQCSRKELKKCYKKVIDGIFLRIRDKEKHNARIDSDDDKSKESRQIVHLNGLSALSTLLDTPDNISFKNDDVFDMEVGLGLRCGRSYNDLSQNFRYFFCRRCFVYNCQDHLERNHPMPFNRKDPPSLSTPPFSRKNVNTIRYKLDHVNRFDEIRSGQDGNKVRTRVTSDSLYTTPTINDHTKKIEHAKKNAFLDIFLKQTLCVNTNETLLSLLHPGKEVEALQYFCKEKKRANHDTRLQRDGNNPSRIPYALYHCKQTDQNTTVLPSSTLSPSPIIKNITYKLAGRSRHWTSSSGAVRVQTMKPKADEEYRMSQTEHTLLTKLDEIFSKHKYNDNNNNSSKYDSSKNDVGKTYSCGDNKLNMSSNSPSRVKKRSRYERIAHVLGTQRPDVVETYLTNVHVRPTDDKSDTDDKDVILCEEISTEIFDQASIRHLTQMQRATGFYKEFRPCSHDGPCGPGGSPECHCALKGSGYCEKYCSCGDECPIKFLGCSKTCSKGGRCRKADCVCFINNRECDPDLCNGCGVENLSQLQTAIPSKSVKNDTKVRKCDNAAMSQKQGKHIVLGRSTIHGWGCFATSFIKKDDFICEYIGEKITQAESNRRGRIYDKIDSSFLFDLNEDYVIDARYRGSKTKFINHSTTPNCEIRVMYINCEHRIGLYAKQNILTGEELCFDYGYKRNGSKSFIPLWTENSDDNDFLI